MGKHTYSFRDHDNEKAVFTCPAPDATALNIDAIYQSAIDLQTELVKVSLGNLVTRNTIAKSSAQGLPEKAASKLAQREAAAMVIYADNVTFETGRLQVPVVDLSKMMDDYPGFFYLNDHATGAHADWQDFVAQLEANLTEAFGNAHTVVRAYHIGKNT